MEVKFPSGNENLKLLFDVLYKKTSFTSTSFPEVSDKIKLEKKILVLEASIA